jgi:hypothetical protein
MKFNQILETTVASMPEPGQEPFRSGRNQTSLEEMTAGGTSSGSVASVSKPLGKMHKRVTEETCESCDCPKSKCGCNESVSESSILQGIIEADLQETDFILHPNKGRRLKPGLLTKQIGTPNPADNVRIDIPLLIRLLEYAREDAGSDLDLHDLAEKLIMCGARGKMLTMRDYDKLVDNVDEGFNPEYDDEAGMTDNNLETLRRAIDGIDEIIQPNDNLPEWCQEKIAIAKSSLINVWDYMKSEEDRMPGSDNDLEEDWQKVNRKDKTSGMSGKAVKAYRRENPGSKLKTAVTTKPSKLKKGSKAANRRKSFCARMSGMKKSRTSAKTARDPDSNINKALRRWNCESIEDMRNLIEHAQRVINEEKQRLDPSCWKGYKKQGTKMKGGVRVNNCVPKESVGESLVKEQKIHSKLIKILQQNGFQGPYAVSETPWANQFSDVILPDDQIMIQGPDVEYDAWVLNPTGDYGYYFGQESGYQSGDAQQVVSWLKTVI